MSDKLQAKDLINIGIFTAIYYVLFFAASMLGYIPILFIMVPLYVPIITGVAFMLFLTKVKKFGMITIMSLILGMIFFATGHTWISMLTAIIFGLLADFIFKSGKYQSFTHSVIGYSVFSLWSLGSLLPMWIMRDSYFVYIRDMMGDEYADKILAMTPTWVLFAMIAMGLIGGIIGAFFGKSLLKKHFQRAGIL